ncbi:hypothetical protein [Amphritea sp. HPY]|uniref:hypothetical protein n=1 Tax=Amphritea sp. HPY TaxID=3421652 RepID=UPI003D7C7921
MGKTLGQPLSYEDAELRLSEASEYVADDELYIINILCLHDVREKSSNSKDEDLEVSIRQLETAIAIHEKNILAR